MSSVKVGWVAALLLGLGCSPALAPGEGGAWAAPEGEMVNALSSREVSDGWTLLFDGRSTAGWRTYKKTGVGPGWVVSNGVLTLADPAKAEDIITLGQYADFDLSFDWRISQNGNSGVYYHVIEAYEYGYQSGPEYQLLDNAHGEPPKERAAAVYALYAPSPDATKPVGKFNRSRILVSHGHVEHWLNGVKVLEYDLGSPDFQARVAASKFHRWPLFARSPTGYLSLQDHGDVVGFRNIKIKVLH